jgi:serine/threonine-protein kinase SRPK3
VSLIVFPASNIIQDFRPTNILSRLENLDHPDEGEITSILGRPLSTQVLTLSGEPYGQQTAPQYLVYPIKWDDVQSDPSATRLIANEVTIIDFGGSYPMVDGQLQDLGIPQAYAPPEYLLDHVSGEGADLWALGCTLFEIRTARKLFQAFDNDIDEQFYSIVIQLGRLPEPWWSTTWEGRRRYFSDENDAIGQPVEAMPEEDVGSWRLRSLQDATARGLDYEIDEGPMHVKQGIEKEEIDLFAHLLGKVLRYDHRDRIPAREVLEHPWFKL